MVKEAITQAKCREKIIEALMNAEEDHMVYGSAADFNRYIGFPVLTRSAMRMIHRALKDLENVTVRKIGGNYEYIDKAKINDEPLSKLLSAEIKSPPELILTSDVNVYFLPVESKWTEHIIALIANTSLSLHIITMTPTYNGILIYVRASYGESFVKHFEEICKLA